MRKLRYSFGDKLQLLLILLALIFVVRSFIVGSNGFQSYLSVKKEFKSQQENFIALQNEVVEIKKEIQQLKEGGFFIEKIAREDLQMARPSEKMYIL